MRTTRTLIVLVLALILATTLAADGRRRAVGPPADAAPDALGIGRVGGATIAGTVASVSGTILTLNTGTAQQIRIEAANAKIMAMKDGVATIAAIQPGARVTAFVTPSPLTVVGAPLIAQVITVESLADLLVAGSIESIDVAASKFTVLGIAVDVDAKTSFGSMMPTFAPIRGLADLAVGQIVTADITVSGSKLLARRVMVAAPVIESLSLRGKVKSIAATSWVITDRDGKDLAVSVNEQTKISGNPVVGDEVQIVATRDSSGAYAALLIVKLEPLVQRDVDIKGYVKSIAPDKWSIGGPTGSMMPEFLVKITPNTVIYPDPKVGDKVVVTGSRDAAGVFTASKITKG
ncbi:MAG: DUF5666 domain-containing protein [Thermoanaerobaculia bacterium]